MTDASYIGEAPRWETDTSLQYHIADIEVVHEADYRSIMTNENAQ